MAFMSQKLSSLIIALTCLGWGLAAGIYFAPEDTAPRAIPAAMAAVEARGSAPATLPSTEAPPKSPAVALIRETSPAVVTVGAYKRRLVANPWQDFFNPYMFQYREKKERIPYMGSGALVDRDGHIITNFHVVEDATNFFVTFPDGRQFDAELLDADRYVDVALLQIDSEGEELPEPINWGDSDDLQIGESVVAFGNPFGNLINDPRPTVTTGVVSALHRTFRPDVRNQRVYSDMIQTDAAINPGNSGGPLIDAEGNLVGINTFIFSASGTNSGVGFAIPANRVRNFFEEVKKFGRLRPLLVDFDISHIRTPRIQGLQVTAVDENGPADHAGLQAGDIITHVDGRRVFTREDFLLTYAGKQVGDKFNLNVIRRGDELNLTYEVRAAKR